MGVSNMHPGRGEDRHHQFQPDPHRHLRALLPAGEPDQAHDPGLRGGPGPMDPRAARTGSDRRLQSPRKTKLPILLPDRRKGRKCSTTSHEYCAHCRCRPICLVDCSVLAGEGHEEVENQGGGLRSSSSNHRLHQARELPAAAAGQHGERTSTTSPQPKGTGFKTPMSTTSLTVVLLSKEVSK